MKREVGVVGIIGVGLIGASIGLRSRGRGLRVLGFDAFPVHGEQALRVGAIDATCEDALVLAGECDTLVIAAPIDETLALLEILAARSVRASLILDVASVKGCVASAGARVRGFIPTHPIAGSERSGPIAACADLFLDRVWTYVPGDAELNERAVAFIEMMGARPLAVDAEEHDRIVAATSHLPQMVSVALAAFLKERLEQPTVRALVGTGLRSMTRLGASGWSMWRGILEHNAANVAQEVRRSAAILASIADEIEGRDARSLSVRFAEAALAVERLREDETGSAYVPEMR